MLHITNGSAVGDKLQEAGLPGDISISADVLHEGPCPSAATATAFRETRARYLAEAGYAEYDEALAGLVRSDAALHAALDEDEVVLWFEHDLFDQLQILRLLASCVQHGSVQAALTIICIGAYPGVSRFVGLGQLSVSQLRELFPGRTAVTSGQLHGTRRRESSDEGDLPGAFHSSFFILHFSFSLARATMESDERPSPRLAGRLDR